MAEGNGELTREILRAELSAGLATQTVSLRQEMDSRFKPVNEHIARVDRGELTFAQQAAIISVIRSDRDESLNRRALRAPIWSLVIAAIALVATVLMTLSIMGVLQ